MSTATTAGRHALAIDPETGEIALDGVGYTQLTWEEHRILEDLLGDVYGPCAVQVQLPVDLDEPPF